MKTTNIQSSLFPATIPPAPGAAVRAPRFGRSPRRRSALASAAQFALETLEDRIQLASISAISPPGGGIGVAPDAHLSVTFATAMDTTTITPSNMEILDSLSQVVPARLSYNAFNNTATLDALSPLSYGQSYSIFVRGGGSGVKDSGSGTLAADSTTAFTTAQPPTSGPGGPILVITNASNNAFSTYYPEILRAEGLNEFATADISTVDAPTLANYKIVLLGQTPLTAAQVAMFTTWVNGGGDLIAMHPDKQLAGLLGITDTGASTANTYLKVNNATTIGAGIVDASIQYHGSADLYTPTTATPLAALFSDSTTATSNPAVTIRSVGSNGGWAGAFTFDLAQSIVLTRQGNPAWAGQHRDGQPVTRPDDQFYGPASFDPQANWIDLTKVNIPQADEQQRLLANMIEQMTLPVMPMPRFWYFPNDAKAVVVMTGDDHNNGGTSGRWSQYQSAGTSGGMPITATSYIFPGANNTDSTLASYVAAGFEPGLHVDIDSGTVFGNNGSPVDWTSFAQLDAAFTSEIATFQSAYPSLPSGTTLRTHGVVWSDYASQPQVEFNHGIRMDLNYYYWPQSWIQDNPGLFTGSAMPMRFATATGSMIDTFQLATQMTDESGQVYPYNVDTLLNGATGPSGYYGAFAVNAHTDSAASAASDAVIASAQAHNVPVMSAQALLNFTDGRDGSSFGSLAWNSATSSLTFNISMAVGATGLDSMVPLVAANGANVSSITINGSPVSYTPQLIKGIYYAVFPAAAGAVAVQYAASVAPLTVSATTPPAGATGVPVGTTVTATFSKAINPATLTFVVRDPGNQPLPATVSYNSSTGVATLTPASVLHYSTGYSVLVSALDSSGNPMTPVVWSFSTAAPVLNAPSYSLWTNATTPAVPSSGDTNAVEVGVHFSSDVSGFINGIRFYEGAGNTGTHVGNLWTASGNLLATATFTNVNSIGWQTVYFSTPVAISANTIYVASYHTNTGNYSYDLNYFATTGADSGPIHAPANSLVGGGNGVYAIGASTFPNLTNGADNFWVDVVFSTVDITAPTVISQSPAPNATNVPLNSPVTAVFSESINPATLSFSLTSSSGTVPASVTYTDANHTASLVPSSALANGVAYTATVSGVQDLAGNPIAAPVSWSFTAVPLQISDTTSAQLAAGTPGAGAVVMQGVQGGVQLSGAAGADFTAAGLPADWTSSLNDTGGTATVANGILSVDGTLAGPSATFNAGTSLQFVATFSDEPFEHAGFGVDLNLSPNWAIFSAGGNGTFGVRTNANGIVTTTQLSGALLGSPHLYRIDWTSTGVTYWVDGQVVAAAITPISTPMRALFSDQTAGGGTVAVDWMAVSPYASSGAFTSRVLDAGAPVNWGTANWGGVTPSGTAITLSARTGNTPIPDGSWTPFTTLSGPGALVGGTSRYLQYQATLSTTDATQTPVLQNVVFNYTNQVDTTAPTVTAQTPAPSATGVALNATVTATFSESIQPATGSFVLTDPSNSVIPSSLSYNSTTHVLTLIPNAPLGFLTVYTATVTGVQDLAGNSLASPAIWSFTTVPDTTPPTVTAQTPAPSATGVALNTTVTATFSKPIQPATGSFVLTGPSNSVIASTLSYNSTTHVLTLTPNAPLGFLTVFTATVTGVQDLAGNPLASPAVWSFTTVPDTTPPTVTAQTPAPSATGVTLNATVTATFSEAIQAATGSFVLTGPANSVIASSLSYNSTTHVLTLTPSAALSNNTLYTATVTGVQDLAGNLLASPAVWSFTTVPDTTPPTVTAQTPAPSATGVAINTTVTATFSEPVQPPTGSFVPGTASFVLTGPSSSVIASTLSYNSATNTLTLTPNVPLGNNTIYTATVTGVKDLAGNPLASPVAWSFTTVPDTTAPTVTARTPAPSATGVALNATVTATFSEAIQPATGSFVLTGPSSSVIASTLSYNSTTNTLTLTPNVPLSSNTIYTATVTGVKDLAGNPLALPVAWSFTTVSDTTAPTVIAENPASNARNVAINTTVAATFSEAIQPGTGSFVLTGQSASVIPTTLSYNSATHILTLTPNSLLANNTTYTATVIGVRDLAGNPLANFVVWSFTTAAPNPVPTVIAQTPAPGATGVARNTTVTATFSEAIQPASGSFVLTGPANSVIAATLSYNSTTHTLTLTPNASLSALTTYTATVTGVLDQTGNPMPGSSVWSFTTAPNTWTQTTAADFSAGTQSNTAITNTAGGEVQLAQTSDPFAGTALGAAWATTSWAGSGGGPFNVTVANSIVSIRGGQVATVASVPVGTAFEARLAFGASAWQHAGLATGLATAKGNSWAIFSTNSTNNTLYARVNLQGTQKDVSLGALPTGMHVYRIQPTGSGFAFYVDGVLKTTLAGTMPAGTALKTMFSDFNGTTPMQVDSVSYGAYASSGTFTSSTFDAGKTATWSLASWSQTLPANTTVTVQISGSSDGSTWGAWQKVSNNASISPALTARYVRYQVIMTSTNPAATPVLSDITLSWS